MIDEREIPRMGEQSMAYSVYDLRPKKEKERPMKWLVVSGIFFASFFLPLSFFFPTLTLTPERESKPERHLQVVEGSVNEKGTLYESL
jgi:hypothetical protein